MRRSVLFGICCLLLVPRSVPAQAKKESVFDKMLHSSVFVVAPMADKKRASTGTGSYVGTSPKKNPVIITNYHVIAPVVETGADREVRVMFPARNSQGELEQNRNRYAESINDPVYVFRGRVLTFSKPKDLALVELLLDRTRNQQLPRGTHPIPLASGSPTPSTRVHTVGNTGAGGMWSYTPGNVRSVYERAMRSLMEGEEVLEVKARIIEATNQTNQGDSGGPLVNDDGELVGVTQGGIIKANGIAIFIDIQEVKTLLRDNKIDIPRRASTVAQSTPQRSDGKTEGELPRATSKVEEKKADPREAAAESKLRNAKRAIREKDYKLAEGFLKDLLDLYDDSKAAVEAKALLEELKKKK